MTALGLLMWFLGNLRADMANWASKRERAWRNVSMCGVILMGLGVLKFVWQVFP